MNFSFVLPTLGNKDLVLKFLNSLERTTHDKKNIEVLFAIDEGKTEIVGIVEAMKYTFKITFFERPSTRDFTNDYYNFLANQSTGKNVIAFNDDAWMRTQDWDSKILREIKAYGWTVYMLDIVDTARIKYNNNFPCFPCVSRRAMNTLGWLLNKDVPMYPADQATWMVYREAKRLIPIKNVLIEHEHISETDGSKDRMMEIFKESQGKVFPLGEYITKLAVVAGSENTKKFSKINRIINILRE